MLLCESDKKAPYNMTLLLKITKIIHLYFFYSVLVGSLRGFLSIQYRLLSSVSLCSYSEELMCTSLEERPTRRVKKPLFLKTTCLSVSAWGLWKCEGIRLTNAD